jgi:hypothetical protein
MSMTTEATGAEPQQQLQPHIDAAKSSCIDTTVDDSQHKPTGLHSPPDSNNAVKLDGSDDSELSDLDDAAADFDFPLLMPQPPSAPETSQPSPPQTETKDEEDDQEDDIGEVTPDHWSGTVPVFKPDMHQFKDFKKFVRPSSSFTTESLLYMILCLSILL